MQKIGLNQLGMDFVFSIRREILFFLSSRTPGCFYSKKKGLGVIKDQKTNIVVTNFLIHFCIHFIYFIIFLLSTQNVLSLLPKNDRKRSSKPRDIGTARIDCRVNCQQSWNFFQSKQSKLDKFFERIHKKKTLECCPG